MRSVGGASKKVRGQFNSVLEDRLPERGRILDRGVFKDYKICALCERPMVRRKKWKADQVWNNVKYCSDKCRKSSK